MFIYNIIYRHIGGPTGHRARSAPSAPLPPERSTISNKKERKYSLYDPSQNPFSRTYNDCLIDCLSLLGSQYPKIKRNEKQNLYPPPDSPILQIKESTLK